MSSIRLQSLCVTDKTQAASIAVYSTSRWRYVQRHTNKRISRCAARFSNSCRFSRGRGQCPSYFQHVPTFSAFQGKLVSSRLSSFRKASAIFGGASVFQYLGCVRDVGIMAAVTFLFDTYFQWYYTLPILVQPNNIN